MRDPLDRQRKECTCRLAQQKHPEGNRDEANGHTKKKQPVRRVTDQRDGLESKQVLEVGRHRTNDKRFERQAIGADESTK